jgi:dolichol-phosphate mannosyltransferase
VLVIDALIIIPTYNEATTIDGIVRRIRDVTNSDILIVDDNSPDGTGEIADRLSHSDSSVYVLHRNKKNGLGPAYLAGFAWALERKYRFVAEIDADGSHDPASLATMLDIASNTDASLVLGSRWIRGGQVDGWSRVRELLSRAGNAYARFALGSRIHDLTGGFRVITTEVLRRIGLSTIASSGYSFQIEVAHRIESTGATIIEHPITFHERTSGVSKMHLGIVIEAIWRITVWGFARVIGLMRPSIPAGR